MDSGSPVLNSTSILKVNITDVNDNEPLFNQSEYSVTLLEGTNIGDVFATVTAVDVDEGVNSKVPFLHYCAHLGVFEVLLKIT